jgi:hypothetical protein
MPVSVAERGLLNTTDHTSCSETPSRVTSQAFRGQSKGYSKNTSEHWGMGRFELNLPYNNGDIDKYSLL